MAVARCDPRHGLELLMHVYQFPCPHCAARLRLRDKNYAGRTVVCPDCRQPLKVVAAEDGSLFGCVPEDRTGLKSSGTSAATTIVEGAPAASGKPDTERETAVSSSSLGRRKRRPAAIAGLGLGGFVAVMAVVLIAGHHNSRDDAGATGPAAVTDSAGHARAPEPVQPAVVDVPDDAVDVRLKRMADWMAGYVEAHGSYPQGAPADSHLPVEQRLGWMARLAADHAAEGGLPPQWDRPWQDPLNDRFVRRRIDVFQNPDMTELVGADGYPAGHFVGMAGVGADAAELPLHHGRAGIFGLNRTTRVEDVRDGTANTIMVAGVQSSLASWAAGGAATIRPFAQEPYINGPDGFGTGQQDGMYVLMADGSVRFLSRGTDPLILRRMAAMADGLPLDAQVPGEPGTSGLNPPPVAGVPPVRVHEAAIAAAPPAEQAPIDVPLAPDVPLIDVDAALRQRIASIEQSEPVPASKLLQQIAEMAGVTIDARSVLDDPKVAPRLNAPVTLSLSDTTVGDILQSVLRQAGLKSEAGSFGIRVTAGETAAP